MTQATGYSSSGAIQSNERKTYDAMNWVTTDAISSTSTLTETTSSGYDLNGNLTGEQLANGELHQYVYDGAGERTYTFIYGAGFTALNGEQDVYDAAGNGYYSSRFDGSSHEDFLDGDNRATSSLDWTATGSTPSITTTVTFDPDGNTLTRQLTEQTPSGSETHSYGSAYNAADWLMSELDSGPGAGQTTTYKRDANGVTRSTSVTSTASNVVTATTDEQNRVTALSENVGSPAFSSSFTCDTNSNLTKVALKSGSVTVPMTLTYDNGSRLTKVDESSPVTGTTGLTNTYSYSYDGLNRTSSITARVNGSSTSTTLGHNGLGELTTAGTKSYSYNPSGNLQAVSGSGITETYSYGDTTQPDELTG
ncbi:MAG: hypothetical protein P4L86_16305, partial [Mycobacterium sp.]|nr:hypothetical protein [Mycobacterium sp.]